LPGNIEICSKILCDLKVNQKILWLHQKLLQNTKSYPEFTQKLCVNIKSYPKLLEDTKNLLTASKSYPKTNLKHQKLPTVIWKLPKTLTIHYEHTKPNKNYKTKQKTDQKIIENKKEATPVNKSTRKHYKNKWFDRKKCWQFIDFLLIN
jgi:hypothetical protein